MYYVYCFCVIQASYLKVLQQLCLIKWPVSALQIATAHFRLFYVNREWNFLLEFKI